MLRKTTAFCVFMLLGCAESFVSVEVSADALIVFAQLDANGDPSATGLISPSDPETRATVPEGDALVLFSIPVDRISARGPQALADPEAVVLDESTERCGRCVGPDFPVLAPGPGDVCDIPSWAQQKSVGEPSPEAVERARQRLGISFSGTCGCRVLSAQPTTAIVPELVGSAEEPSPPALLSAVLADGALGIFGRTRWVVERAGQASAPRIRSKSPLMLGVAAVGQRFVVAFGTSGARETLQVLDENLEVVDSLEIDSGIRFVVGVPGTSYFAAVGKGDSRSAIYLCAVDPLTCAQISPPRAGDVIVDVTRLADGRLVALKQAGGLIVYDSAPDPRTVTGVSSEEVSTSSGAIRIRDVAVPLEIGVGSLGSLGARLFGCGSGDVVGFRAWSASLSESGLTDVRVIESNGRCGGLGAVGGDGLLRLVVNDAAQSRMKYFDAAGTEVREARPIGAPAARFRARVGANGVTLLTDEFGRRFSELPDGSFVRVYGPETVPHAGMGLVSVQGESWAVGPSSRARIVDLESVIEGGLGDGSGRLVSDGQWVYALTSEGISRLDVSTGVRESVVSASELLAPWETGWIEAPEPGVVVFLGSEASRPVLFRFRDGVRTRFEIDWDDPTTPEVEVSRLLGNALRPQSFRTQVWAPYGDYTRRHGAVFMLLPWLEPPIAVHHSATDPAAIVPLCGDSARIFARGTGSAFALLSTLELNRGFTDLDVIPPLAEGRSVAGENAVFFQGALAVLGSAGLDGELIAAGGSEGWFPVDGKTTSLLSDAESLWMSAMGRIYRIRVD